MIINTTESNEKGLWWIKFFNLDMKDIRKYAIKGNVQGWGVGVSQKLKGFWRGAKAAHAKLEQLLRQYIFLTPRALNFLICQPFPSPFLASPPIPPYLSFLPSREVIESKFHLNFLFFWGGSVKFKENTPKWGGFNIFHWIKPNYRLN